MGASVSFQLKNCRSEVGVKILLQVSAFTNQTDCQLLCGSTLLPRPSTLKLISLPLVREHLSTLRSMLGNASHFTLTSVPLTNNEVVLYSIMWPGREGVIARENPAYKLPLHFVLRLRLQKGGRICGTLQYMYGVIKYCLRTIGIPKSFHYTE